MAQTFGGLEFQAARHRPSKEYGAFVEKFQVKHTTDDCYTPPKVYEAVLKFCRERLGVPADAKIVRPFCPGGDFETFEYPDGCVVIDNPPFSIYAKIVRFYLEHGLKFFLFCPHLTAIVQRADVCYVLTNAAIVYENGAKVNTSFCTNLEPELRVWACPELKDAIERACTSKKPPVHKLEYPVNVLTTARLRVLNSLGAVEYRLAKDQCEYVAELDNGGRIFGGGLLLSTKAAAERVAAEREAARLASPSRVFKMELSERELQIIRDLDGLPPEPRL